MEQTALTQKERQLAEWYARAAERPEIGTRLKARIIAEYERLSGHAAPPCRCKYHDAAVWLVSFWRRHPETIPSAEQEERAANG